MSCIQSITKMYGLYISFMQIINNYITFVQAYCCSDGGLQL